jgi:hypothetical protein
MLHQRSDVAVELLLLRVCRLGQFAQEHRCTGDVLPSPHKLQGPVGVCDDGLLDLIGACPRAAHNVMSIRLEVAPGVHRRWRRLALPLLA